LSTYDVALATNHVGKGWRMDRPALTETRRLALDTLVRRVGALAMAVAGGLWLWSASVQIGDNAATAQTQFQWMAELNRYGSAAAVVAAICAMLLFLLKPADRPRQYRDTA
jgi:hypothetical protein